ncbi:MAG: hypothetical protein CMP10_18680 [Zetaproteobacteria bacterium]|nr:hypothetical protein [Pseudobdellovibrionaceae bacterium]
MIKPDLTKNQIRQAIAVTIAIIAMGHFYFTNMTILKDGHSLTLKVTGYDPRDLISGYYLRYQVDYGMDVCQKATKGKDVCVCFDDKLSPLPHKAMSAGHCLEKATCSIKIRGQCKRGHFRAGIERYFIPEDKRHQVAVIPPESTIEVKVDSDGKAVTKGFFVDGTTLEDYLQNTAN